MSKVETVVVGTDFSQCAEAGLTAAAHLLPPLGFERIHVVNVVETSSWVSPPLVAYAELLELAMDSARQRLQDLEVEVEGVEITREARVGSPARELARAAEDVGASLIVSATHGRTGLARAVLGSVASDLVRLAHVPVMVIPAEGYVPERFRRVLAAIDLSPVSELVLEAAARWARGEDEARVRVLSMFEHPIATLGDGEVLPHYPSREEIDRIGVEVRARVERLVEEVVRHEVPVDVEVMSKGPPAQVILDVAGLTESDLVVVGTSGNSAWHRMIVGSTATRVLAEAGRPVLVVPHDVREEAPDQDAVPIRRARPSVTPSPEGA